MRNRLIPLAILLGSMSPAIGDEKPSSPPRDERQIERDDDECRSQGNRLMSDSYVICRMKIMYARRAAEEAAKAAKETTGR